ncbi:hypothetical protein [Capnocytophaga catalasegens]|uniref:Uncharacterized protein n=1 Tax=Capnocytophaga catalasegens TaxID=1004260 RepID=A0AAV5AXB3_9FLAO|nr:hypothetical protein RCZ03_19260 [Capnocytophaga catalasegens]GJM49990.1 hypothetical protein RCZ15_09650 [Capnocytophaga catalasegens]GJM54118.1 hypothetical protein RCZ16_24340 [Capnocytophaga catalasegens]
MNKIIEIIAYCIPAIIVGIVAYYFFFLHYKNEEKRRKFYLLKENQKQALPLRLQAYERITLFLDRISPQKMLMRVTPLSQDKRAYELLLIQQIDSEFDHNITQQIYISEATWNVVKAAKSATIQIIRKVATSENITDADTMRTAILSEFIDKQTPSNQALSHIVNEVKEFLY